MTEPPTEPKSTGHQIIVGVVLAMATAIIGYLIAYLDQHRKEQVAFVNTQIEKLYGPLFALIQANDIAWAHFREGYWKGRRNYFDPGSQLEPADIDLWRRWMRNVFQPINVKMEEVLVNNAQLLVGEKMPPMFLQFVSHTEAYKAVISTWKDGSAVGADEISPRANVSPVAFPEQPQFSNCIIEQFHNLKALQQMLQEQWIGSLGPLKEELPADCGSGR